MTRIRTAVGNRTVSIFKILSFIFWFFCLHNIDCIITNKNFLLMLCWCILSWLHFHSILFDTFEYDEKFQVRYVHVLTFKVNKTLGWCVVLVRHWVALFPEISIFFSRHFERKILWSFTPFYFLTTKRVLEFMRVIYILESCM